MFAVHRSSAVPYHNLSVSLFRLCLRGYVLASCFVSSSMLSYAGVSLFVLYNVAAFFMAGVMGKLYVRPVLILNYRLSAFKHLFFPHHGVFYIFQSFGINEHNFNTLK